MNRRQFFESDSFHIEDSVQEEATRLSVLRAVKNYYLAGHTCKETCEVFGIEYSAQMQKLFWKLFPKGMGWGGRRKNSGNKKGIKFSNSKSNVA